MGLFHRCLVDKELPIDIQLFSGFLTALVSFSTQIHEHAVRNVDFIDSRFSFINDSHYLLIVRTLIEGPPLERTLQQLHNLNQELKQESELMKLLEDSENFRKYPLQAFSSKFAPIFNQVMEQGLESELQLRQIDLMAITQLGKGIYQLVSKLILKEQDLIDKSPLIENNVIFKLITSNEDINLTALPDLPYSSFTNSIKDFLLIIAKRIKDANRESDKSLMNELRVQLIDFLSQNYRLLKYFNLDEIISTKILPLFR